MYITFKSILFEKILKLLPIDIDVILWYNLFRRLKYLLHLSQSYHFLIQGIKMLLNIIIEKDQDGYFARILELEGCVSQGNTYEEALVNIKEAGELYLESLANEEKRIIENKTTSIIPMVLANA